MVIINSICCNIDLCWVQVLRHGPQPNRHTYNFSWYIPINSRISCIILKFDGLKVFMDARMPVTHKEGDRYPLRPPQLTTTFLKW